MIEKINLSNFLKITNNVVATIYPYIGKGNKNKIDELAVSIMAKNFKTFSSEFLIKSGEGKLDEAPRFYEGEIIGKGETKYDLIIDPVEGTANCAFTKGPSVSCFAIASPNSFPFIEEMYMEKLLVKSNFVGNFSLDQDILEIINNLLIQTERLTFAILNKPRHFKLIKKLQNIKALNLILLSDGDVIATIGLAFNMVDVVYGIGGSSEGLLMAVIAKNVGCHFSARLVLTKEIYPNEINIKKITYNQQKFMVHHGWSSTTILKLSDLITTQSATFFASFITDFLNFSGVEKKNNRYYCDDCIIGNNFNKIIKAEFSLNEK